MTLEQLAKQTAHDIWGVRPDKQEQIILAALKSAERKGQLDVVAQIDARCNDHEEAMCIADEFEEVQGMSHAVVGACPKCGAPVYTESPWFGVTPPPSIPSCSCNPRTYPLTTTTTGTFNA